MRAVAICGGNGVLGQRLAKGLLLESYHVLLLDDYDGFHEGNKRIPELGDAQVKGKLEHVQADLTQWGDWILAFKQADAVVHFAAVNPYPEATWEDSRLSMRMHSNVIAAVQQAGTSRLVLASSSHVLGGYLQGGAHLSSKAHALGPDTPLRHFTKFELPGLKTDASPYAAAKVAMEEMAQAATMATPGLSVVVIRIGWCQPGENRPIQMTATATPTISGDTVVTKLTAEDEIAQGFDDRNMILAWLHRIWLSTRDFDQLFKRAICSDIKGYLCVSGVSRNKDMRWSTQGWDKLGYQPLDDVEQALNDDDALRKRRKTEL